jgi:hypothetical protein
MFKKVTYAIEDEYNAILVDWQGACYGLLSRNGTITSIEQVSNLK